MSRPFVTARISCICGVAALGAGLAMSNGGEPAEKFIPSEHPSAILAWVNMRCSPGPALREGAPLAQAEDVYAVSAAYETATRYRPLEAVCADARFAARNVAGVALDAAPGARNDNLVAAR